MRGYGGPFGLGQPKERAWFRQAQLAGAQAQPAWTWWRFGASSTPIRRRRSARCVRRRGSRRCSRRWASSRVRARAYCRCRASSTTRPTTSSTPLPNEQSTTGADEKWVETVRRDGAALIADIEGSKPGPTWALRFDTDALPIEESSSSSHVPQKEGFRSTFEHGMHACGHDGHVAIGLALAERLKAEPGLRRHRALPVPARRGRRPRSPRDAQRRCARGRRPVRGAAPRARPAARPRRRGSGRRVRDHQAARVLHRHLLARRRCSPGRSQRARRGGRRHARRARPAALVDHGHPGQRRHAARRRRGQHHPVVGRADRRDACARRRGADRAVGPGRHRPRGCRGVVRLRGRGRRDRRVDDDQLRRGGGRPPYVGTRWRWD